MSKFPIFLVSFVIALVQANVLQSRFRRQYQWGTPSYYENGQYYETQPWSNQYQNNQNYYSPYFYGYQHQQTWQTSNNHNSYQTSSSYNRPSFYGNGNTNQGYATAPPSYNSGSYARPKYLATMEPKPTLSPVVLERSTFFVTQQPEVIRTTSTSGGSGRHPTFLERLGVATLPAVPSNSEEAKREKALASLEALDREQEFLPERSTEESELSEDRVAENGSEVTERTPEKTSWEPSFFSSSAETTTEPTIETTEMNVVEKDEKTSHEFFETSSTEEASSTTEVPEESTTAKIEETTETESTTTEGASTISEATTAEPTTTSEMTTSTTAITTTTTKIHSSTTVPTTTRSTTTKEVEPVTLLAFQEVTNEVVSSASNITQPSSDQDTSDLNETGEGSGGSSFASTGIVGFRAPPLPKRTDPEKVGLEVVEWTDSDNEVRKVLSQ